MARRIARSGSIDQGKAERDSRRLYKEQITYCVKKGIQRQRRGKFAIPYLSFSQDDQAVLVVYPVTVHNESNSIRLLQYPHLSIYSHDQYTKTSQPLAG